MPLPRKATAYSQDVIARMEAERLASVRATAQRVVAINDAPAWAEIELAHHDAVVRGDAAVADIFADALAKRAS